MQRMKIGDRITQARKQLKWSQADLGQKVGVSREIEELAPEVKDKLLFLANAVIRDHKAGKAYLIS